ncbi:hypothetical protein [Stieleria mannarensis]|uniref:hypothetical protein n=1 Tax=Stieleria mannarensis TaxID=2755585 RepID=UPI0015FF6798|nr:hypothetical protein [Rhodopirellula sp. JC639]
MKPVFSLSIAFILAILGTIAHAEAPRVGSRQPITTVESDVIAASPTVSRSAFQDMLYDYEVYSAPDVSGETEFVIIGRDAETGSWDFVHRFEWTGSVDHGSWSDRGVWTFSSWWSARNAAENQIDDGKITDYEIIEQPVQPQWTYEATLPTRAQAEDYADEIEYWSNEFNVPHVTKIVPVLMLSYSTVGTLK